MGSPTPISVQCLSEKRIRVGLSLEVELEAAAVDGCGEGEADLPTLLPQFSRQAQPGAAKGACAESPTLFLRFRRPVQPWQSQMTPSGKHVPKRPNCDCETVGSGPACCSVVPSALGEIGVAASAPSGECTEASPKAQKKRVRLSADVESQAVAKEARAGKEEPWPISSPTRDTPGQPSALSEESLNAHADQRYAQYRHWYCGPWCGPHCFGKMPSVLEKPVKIVVS